MMYILLFIGGHTLSGACIETDALDELIPDWKEKEVFAAIFISLDLGQLFCTLILSHYLYNHKLSQNCLIQIFDFVT